MRALEGRPAFLVTPGRSRGTVAVICSKCGVQESGTDKPACPPEVVSKHFIARGWRVVRNGASAVCPACLAREPAVDRSRVAAEDEAAALADLQRQQEAEARRQATTQPIEPPRASETTMADQRSYGITSKDALRAQRHLHQLLGEHFSVEGDLGSYDEGWDDKRISSETGLALAEVVRTREAAYGRVVDPRVLVLEQAVKLLAEKLQRDADELHALADNLKTEHAATVVALTEQIAVLGTAKGRTA